MCTDRTLNDHIRNYHDVTAQIKALEEIKRKESAWIIEELDNRELDKWDTVRISSRTEEKPDKELLMTLYPEIYDEVKKTVVSARFLRKCRA